MHVKIDVDKDNGIEEHQGKRQKRDTQGRILNASRIPEAVRDAPIGVVLIGLDGHFEDGLGQHIQQAAAEQRQAAIRIATSLLQEIHPPIRSTR